MKRAALSHIFADLFNIWFKEDSLILTSASTFSLLTYILVEIYDENPDSQRCIIGKGRSVLTVFSHNYGYSFLTLYETQQVVISTG